MYFISPHPFFPSPSSTLSLYPPPNTQYSYPLSHIPSLYSLPPTPSLHPLLPPNRSIPSPALSLSPYSPFSPCPRWQPIVVQSCTRLTISSLVTHSHPWLSVARDHSCACVAIPIQNPYQLSNPRSTAPTETAVSYAIIYHFFFFFKSFCFNHFFCCRHYVDCSYGWELWLHYAIVYWWWPERPSIYTRATNITKNDCSPLYPERNSNGYWRRPSNFKTTWRYTMTYTVVLINITPWSMMPMGKDWQWLLPLWLPRVSISSHYDHCTDNVMAIIPTTTST